MIESHTIGPAADPEKYEISKFAPVAAAALGSYRWPCAGLQLGVEHDVDAIHCHKKIKIRWKEEINNKILTRSDDPVSTCNENC